MLLLFEFEPLVTLEALLTLFDKTEKANKQDKNFDSLSETVDRLNRIYHHCDRWCRCCYCYLPLRDLMHSHYELGIGFPVSMRCLPCLVVMFSAFSTIELSTANGTTD